MTQSDKIKSFTQLHAWQKGHQLVLDIYRAQKEFPQEEKFALSDQIRRAVVSITSNVAEGFSRSSNKEKIHFYSTAVASLSEAQNQLLIARDLGYLDKDTFNKLANDSIEVHKTINGLIRSIKPWLRATNY